MSHKLRLFRNLVEIRDLDKPTDRTKRKVRNDNNRGQQKGFSKQSRTALHRLLERINHPRHPLFVTLTYQRYGDDWKKTKKHLANFAKFLLRQDSGLCSVWRLEFQKRGAPHYHLVVWPGDDDSERNLLSPDLLAKAWVRITGETSRAALRYSCDVGPVRSIVGSGRYLVGHHLKLEQIRDDAHTGRYWGIIGRQNLPNDEPIREHRCSDLCVDEFRRLLSKYLERKRVCKGTLRKLKRGVLSNAYVPLHEQQRLFDLATANTAARDTEPF